MFRKFLFPLLLAPFAGNAQSTNVDDLDLISLRLVNNLRANPKEKIFLETNKKIYAAGETIWFKVYIADSVSDRLINRSKILYVDLVDERDHIIKQLLLDAAFAEQNGAVAVDSSLNGYFWLRAYTATMLDDVSRITVKPVYMTGKNGSMKTNFSDADKNQADADIKPILDVYPEGGALIGGADCVVAVKAHTSAGKALAVSGIVKDNRDDVIAKFSTNNDGLGKFSFSPSSYQTYKLYVQENNTYDSVAVLPRVNPHAAQIAVTRQSQQYVTARVLLEDSIYVKDYKTYIVGLSKDSVCFAAVGKDMFEFNIPLSNFPPGIASLLLFGRDKQLMSVRNIYINKNNINVSITTDKQNYTARDNVQMNIDVSDATGKPLLASLSVSVTDSRVDDTINDFYNEPLSRLSAEDAELVMLAQQPQTAAYWSHVYAGQNVSAPGGKEEGLDISGTLLNEKKEPMSNSEIILLGGGYNNFFLQDTTDASGKFSFPLAGFNNGIPFNLQVKNEQGIKNNYDVVLDSVVHPQFTTPSALKQKSGFYEPLNIKKIETFYRDSVMEGAGWLPPVKVSGSANKNKTDLNSGTIITKDMLSSGSNSLETAILRSGKFYLSQGYLATGGRSGFVSSATDEPAVILDGIQVPLGNEGTSETPSPVLSYLKTFPSSQVDHIRILTGPSAGIYGVRSGHGVIEIYTTPQMNSVSSSTGLKTIYPRGFDTPPLFEMPDYKSKQVKNSHNPDMRTAVYWNANVVTDDNGKATINFFTADMPAMYIVTISGLTVNGNKIFKTVPVYRNLK